MLDKNEIIKKYKSKIKILKKHNNFYFNQDNPKISDAEFDELKKVYLSLKISMIF